MTSINIEDQYRAELRALIRLIKSGQADPEVLDLYLQIKSDFQKYLLNKN